MLDELEWPSLEARRDQPSLLLFHKNHCGAVSIEQEGKVALNRSPEFCLSLHKYLLKAGHVPVDTWGEANFGPRGII